MVSVRRASIAFFTGCIGYRRSATRCNGKGHRHHHILLSAGPQRMAAEGR